MRENLGNGIRRVLVIVSVCGLWGCATQKVEMSKPVQINESLFTLTPIEQNGSPTAIFDTFEKFEEIRGQEDEVKMARYLTYGAYAGAGVGSALLGLYVADSDNSSYLPLGLLLVAGGLGADYWAKQKMIEAGEAHNSKVRGKRKRSALMDWPMLVARKDGVEATFHFSF